MPPEVLGPEVSAASAIAQQVAFDRLLAELSARFINLPMADVDSAITDTLRQIVLLLEVDRSQLIRFPMRPGEAEVTHSWAVDGVPRVPPKAISESFPWVIRQVRAGHAVVVPRVADVPPEAGVDKATWQRIGVRSSLVMPMKVAGRVEGTLAFACLRCERDWPEGLVARVRVLAEVFANALAHKRAQEALDEAMRFERMVTNTLAALLTAERSARDRIIEAGLRDLARMMGVEHAALWQRVADRGEFTKTHRWLDDGVPVPRESTAAIEVPWIAAQLVAGSTVAFGRHADLPFEAESDLPALQALGIGAAVIVPLRVSGSVIGALSLATLRENRAWPDALIPRAKLLGEVFAGVLAREEAERREQEAQAQAAHASRIGTMGVVAASLIHELTQPLAASLANAQTAFELLQDPVPNVEELRATVADIVTDDRRVGDLIGQLRRFLRRGQAERAEQDLRKLIEDVLHFVAGEVAIKGVQIVLDCAPALPTFVGDRVQIQQVLLNLLLNALDAVAKNDPGARRVAVRARPSAGGIGVEVSDDGCGMDEATLARVFQPFFTTKPGGMGLGLAISRTIVAAHGGTLAASSALGHGTTFRMELPLRSLDAVAPGLESKVAANASGNVFVIDDDPSMRRALYRQLRGAGYGVETFASAQAYLDQAHATGVACIVSDVRMPGLSGLDLQATLAESRRPLPVVFISGHGDIPTTVLAMRAGAVAFLSKPFTKGELLAAVAEAMAKSRAIEQARSERADVESRYASLTAREREVFALVVAGLLNKVIADRLGAAETTIKIHRGRVMDKMGAGSVAELVRMSGRLDLPTPESTPR